MQTLSSEYLEKDYSIWLNYMEISGELVDEHKDKNIALSEHREKWPRGFRVHLADAVKEAVKGKNSYGFAHDLADRFSKEDHEYLLNDLKLFHSLISVAPI